MEPNKTEQTTGTEQAANQKAEQASAPTPAPAEGTTGTAAASAPSAGKPEGKHQKTDGKPAGGRPAHRHDGGKPRFHQAPQGALQAALKDKAFDWKAFRDAQIALHRSQKTFWLTDEEADQVNRLIHRLRGKNGRKGKPFQKGGKPAEGKAVQKPVQKSVPNPVKEKARKEAAAKAAQATVKATEQKASGSSAS